MLNGCVVGEHQFEFYQEKAGVTTYKCKNCPELTTEFQDCGSGC